MEDKLVDFLQQMDNVWIVMNHRRTLQQRSWLLNKLAAADWYYQVGTATCCCGVCHFVLTIASMCCARLSGCCSL